MLRDVLADATESLDAYYQAAQRIHDEEVQAQNRRSILDSIRTMNTGLKTTEKAAEVQILSLTVRADLQEEIEAVIRDVEAGQNQLFLSDNLVDQVKRASTHFKAYLTQEWKRAVEEEARPLVSSLRTFSPLLPRPHEIEAIARTIEKCLESMPVRPEEVVQYKQALQTGRDVLAQVGDDPEVKSFIQKLTSRRATFGDLTPNVQAWIQKMNLSSKIRIRFE